MKIFINDVFNFLSMHNFRKLAVWENAMVLAKDVYSITSTYPKEEKYGLALSVLSYSVH